MINWLSTDTDILQTLGQRLREARIAAGLSQQNLAMACGVSLPVVVRMEKGDAGVRISTWISALRAVGKVQNLDLMLPELRLTPYDYAKAAEPRRKRAPRSDRKQRNVEWKWGE